jgi:hypothetical protein
MVKDEAQKQSYILYTTFVCEEETTRPSLLSSN